MALQQRKDVLRYEGGALTFGMEQADLIGDGRFELSPDDSARKRSANDRVDQPNAAARRHKLADRGEILNFRNDVPARIVLREGRCELLMSRMIAKWRRALSPHRNCARRA